MRCQLLLSLMLPVLFINAWAHGSQPSQARPVSPLENRATVVDMDIGETRTVTLSDDSRVTVKVLDVEEQRDAIRRVLRRADVHIEVDGVPVKLAAGMYNLPMPAAGTQVDCPVTGGYNVRSGADYWGLEKDVRLRFWPGDAPLTEPDTFCYPVRQKWFASITWFDNEPVDGGAEISETVYYHAGVDLGGMEGVTEVLAAAEALVVSARNETLPEHEDDSPVRPRDDVVYLLDGRGWYYRYSHFHTIDPAVQPGVVVPMGARLGLVGKEGASGGWSHLHFGIECRQPSGQWGVFASYALLREAYIREYDPKLIAHARHRHLLTPGETITLDGTKSWSAEDNIVSYEWLFTDGTADTGPTVNRLYRRPGRYSEILKVTDAAGRVDYDFALVQVINPEEPNRYAPSLHAVYEPTFDIRPGTPVTFAVRAGRFDGGEDIWDFGDGSAPRSTLSGQDPHPHARDAYAQIEHRYNAPGDYVVRVHRINSNGIPAYAHLHVVVEQPSNEQDAQ